LLSLSGCCSETKVSEQLHYLRDPRLLNDTNIAAAPEAVKVIHVERLMIQDETADMPIAKKEAWHKKNTA
jgi:hypothetical protein